MKRCAYTVILSATLCASFSTADTLTCKDGKVLQGIIKQESKTSVTIRVLGAEVTVPRDDIKSIERTSAEEDKTLGKQWKKLDEHYKEENGESEERDAELVTLEASPTSAAPTFPPVQQPEEQPEPEAISFPAEWPPSELDQPERSTAPTKEQKDLQWIQEVQKAVYEKRVIKGMTKQQVQDAWGFPDWTHAVDNMNTHTDRWTYHRSDGVKYVFFNNGAVVSVSSTGGLR
jgi:hypothetical protein